jgi:hypothetical protein
MMHLDHPRSKSSQDLRSSAREPEQRFTPVEKFAESTIGMVELRAVIEERSSLE